MKGNTPSLQLVYVSRAVAAFTPSDLRELLEKARTNNTRIQVTGLLLYHNLSFFQILEGAQEHVLPLFTQIGKDKRHDNVLLLSKKTVEERNFGEWCMGFIDINTTAGKLPGFVKILEAKSSFLDLQGDVKLVARLIDGFHEGRWRQSIE